MKALITTDGSEFSLAALRAFIARLHWFAETPEISVMTVHPSVPYGGAASWAGKDAVGHYYDEEMSNALAPALAILAEHKLAGAVIKKIGDPSHEIIKHAKEWGAEMIIMGTHGHSGVVTLLMGSVAQKVLASTTIPVLLLK